MTEFVQIGVMVLVAVVIVVALINELLDKGDPEGRP